MRPDDSARECRRATAPPTAERRVALILAAVLGRDEGHGVAFDVPACAAAFTRALAAAASSNLPIWIRPRASARDACAAPCLSFTDSYSGRARSPQSYLRLPEESKASASHNRPAIAGCSSSAMRSSIIPIQWRPSAERPPSYHSCSNAPASCAPMVTSCSCPVAHSRVARKLSTSGSKRASNQEAGNQVAPQRSPIHHEEMADGRHAFAGRNALPQRAPPRDRHIHCRVPFHAAGNPSIGLLLCAIEQPARQKAAEEDDEDDDHEGDSCFV